MKYLPAWVCLIFSIYCHGAAADYITLTLPTGGGGDVTRSAPLELAAGDSATLVYNGQNSGNTFLNSVIEVVIGTQTFLYNSETTPTQPVAVLTIAGPATLRLRKEGSALGDWATFAVTRAGTPVATPANTVVIPEDATGNFEVVLESSTDLVTWSAAMPGTYGGATQRRFFRTRIVKLN